MEGALIRFYLEGGVDAALVDFHLMPDGTLRPHFQSANTTFATNIVLQLDDIGITPMQMDIIRTLGKTQEVVICFLAN